MMLTEGKPSVMEKAVFLYKLHVGMNALTLADRFNFQAFLQIKDWFGSENPDSGDLTKYPVPITIVRPKTDVTYFICINYDAVYSLQKYLKIREKTVGNPICVGDLIFLNTNNSTIKPEWIERKFFILANIHSYGMTCNGEKIHNYLENFQHEM